jgi:hypothetical protein
VIALKAWIGPSFTIGPLSIAFVEFLNRIRDYVGRHVVSLCHTIVVYLEAFVEDTLDVRMVLQVFVELTLGCHGIRITPPLFFRGRKCDAFRPREESQVLILIPIH